MNRRWLYVDTFSLAERRTRTWLLVGLMSILGGHVSAVAQQPVACDGDGQCCRTLDIEIGQRRPVIDAIGCLVGIPDKLLLWDRRAKNHNVGQQTVDDVSDYLVRRGVDDMKVRVNQYDPCGEWQRLVDNRRVAAPWKYTVGLLKHVRYIFLPGRIFGRDEYNPFTNTLSLYSDLPTLGIAEAAYAKDVNDRRFPGTYAAAQLLPLVSLWHETIATNEVKHYATIHASPTELYEIRHVLYARYGIQLGGEVVSVLPDGSSVYTVVGAIAGHTVAAFENHSDGY